MDKLVVHGNDGSISKGYSADFSPGAPYFHLATLQRPSDSEKVWLENQKAVFFVKDFSGDPTRIDGGGFRSTGRNGGTVVVTFKDGERMYGTAESIGGHRAGFFLYPVDPSSNTIKAYLVNRFISGVEIDPKTT
ncbi:MAG TPA: hypothetical protein P5207_06735 [Candidatus Sabulitectum sp.]|nr:hypothetical protein [Candidatus Sabulitectum sp.]HPR22453.1 hypothetical protein [Candidatus Sabulitectum sp.]HRW78351.1 hypothetical protein [Candidatus Sabulitectum sp.]